MIGDWPRSLRRNAGLTLMELLISLALMAFIALGITSSLGMALRVYDHSEELAPQSDPVVYRLHLRHWLANATPPSLLTPFPARFEGSADRLQFITLAETPSFPQAAALRVELAVNEDKLALAFTTLTDDGSDIEVLEKVLVEGVTNARISYLGDDPTNMEWLTEWRSDTALPRAVKITVDPGSRPDWPDLITRIVFAPPV